jgi:hypothetical protein
VVVNTTRRNGISCFEYVSPRSTFLRLFIHYAKDTMLGLLRSASQAARNKFTSRVWTLSESFIKDLGPEASAVKRGLFSFEHPAGKGCLLVDKVGLKLPQRLISELILFPDDTTTCANNILFCR